MNTLQCEMCVQILSPERLGETAASLVKANEAAEMLNPVYVYCEDCRYHLCKRCDYHAHVPAGNTDSSDSEADHLLQHIQKQAPSQQNSSLKELKANSGMEGAAGINYCKNKTDSPQKKNTKFQPNSADKLATSASNRMKQQDQQLSQGATSQQNDESNSKSILPRGTPSAQDHQRIQVCEECLEKHSHAFCPKCEQALCQDCWDKIHNKGARARHRQKSLQRPKFYPPRTWRKASTTNQQSAGSSSQQDSLSQFKHEHVLDEVIVFEEKDRIDRSAMLGSLQVQLVDRQQSQLANQYGLSSNRHMQDVSRQPQFDMPSHSQHFIYGQSPSYMPHPQAQNYMMQQQIASYQQQNSHQKGQGKFAMNAVPFHPQMHQSAQQPLLVQSNAQGRRNCNQPMQSMPTNFDPIGFPMAGQRQQLYMYAGPQVENSQMSHNQHVNYSHYTGELVAPSQQPHFRGLNQQHAYYSDVASRMHSSPKQQAFQPQGEERNHRTRNAQSQLSEDEVSLDTGIQEEALHQLPTAFIELDSGALNRQSLKHGNQNSESQLLERNIPQHSAPSDSTYHFTCFNPQKQKSSAHHDNLNSAQEEKFEGYGGFATQKRGDDSISMGGYDQLTSGSKAFTPLRKGFQSTSECIPSPLLSTPNEQLRVGGFLNSKQMTPPLPNGSSQRQADLKLKSGGMSHHLSKASKPLKVPQKDRAYANAQVNLQGYSYMGKPPTGSEKKGPHIQYQQKTGKPNSMSSHEMNSDNDGETGLHYAASKYDQNSFDAYQVGHLSSQSAKGNPRSHQNMPHGSGSFMQRKNPSSQNHDYSPRSHHSHHSHNSSSGNVPQRHGDQDFQARNRGSRYQNNVHHQQSSKHQKYQYGGDCTNSSGGYNERPQKGNSQQSGQTSRNNSRGSRTNKANSLSNNKSGSVGNQALSLSTYNGNGGKGNPQNAANQRSAASRTNQQSLQTHHVPVFQPVIKVVQDGSQSNANKQKRNTATRRGTQNEETKSATPQPSYHSTWQNENELMAKMQRILFQNAALGDLLILKRKFSEQIQEKLLLSSSDASKAIDRAVSYSIIHQTDRNFANAQKIELISLKIQVLSHQCLQWVITSLRRDEMTPTESAIKNRTKEAFDFKLQNDHWEAIMKSIQMTSRSASSNDASVGLPNQSDSDNNNQQQQQQELSHQFQKRNSVTPPEKGSSAQTQQRNTGRQNKQQLSSSFITQSSASSSQQHNQQAMTVTTTSAQGITKIIKYSIVTEADTARNRPGGNASSGGEPTGSSSEPKSDQQPSSSQQRVEASRSVHPGGDDLRVAPKFKVVLLHGEESGDQVTDNGNTATSGSVHAIYMEDEEVWTGVDIEDDSTVDRRLYQIMKEFLRQYFCRPEDEHSDEDFNSNQLMPSNSDDYSIQGSENLRMIPGGRYGCTQFLKICGPEEIKQCSVGKTTQMVQLAIKEDVLRHLKTQIVWSTQVDKHKSEQDTSEDQQILIQRKAKLEKVKEAIIEILAESKTGPKTGMSLAQLPQYLKKKLPFNLDWNELGFPKLKDLLQSMTDQIIVELRDVNHPFAYLVHHKQRPANQSGHQNKICIDKLMFRENDAQSEQNQDSAMRQMVYDSEKLAQIVQAVFTLLQMQPQGILEMNLKELIQRVIGFEFSFSQLGCGSEYEFVQKYIMPKDDSLEFITMQGNNGQKTFNIRSKKIFRKFFMEQIEQERERMDLEHRGGSKLVQNNQYQPEKNANGLYPSSMSHKNFNKGLRQKNDSNSSLPSEFSSEQPNLDGHQQRIQTQPNDNRMPPFSMEQAYFQTCESIHGSECHSYDSSLHHQVKAISDLSKSIHLDLDSATTPPFTQQAQAMQVQSGHQLQAQHHNPWQAASAQQRTFNISGGGIFDNLKVPSNIHGSVAQTPFCNPQLMQGNLCIPIDQDDSHQVQAQLQQKDVYHTMFHPNPYDESDSPRVQEIIQQQLFGDSPTGQEEYYPQHNQNGAIASGTDSASQNNFSMSDGCFMNQSIFSADFNRMPIKNDFKVDQDGHHSVDLNVNLEQREQKPSQSQEEYFPLLLPQRQSDDQMTSKTWQPLSNLSQKLDFKAVGKPHPVQIPANAYQLPHQASFHEDGKQRITEETSGSHHSSTPLTPQTGEPTQMLHQ